MNPCPTDALLRDVLADLLSQADEAAVAAHVEGCAACQGRLEELTTAAARETPPQGPAGPCRDAAALPAIPGYVIERELGRGGIGIVYLARQTDLDRPVALKVLLDGAYAGPTALARFQDEAQALARLRHPGVVQIHALGSHDGKPFLALEYVAGGSLADHLRGQPQPPRAAAELTLQLAEAVQAVHAQGIVHRDLKPANVLLEGHNPPGPPSLRGKGGDRTFEVAEVSTTSPIRTPPFPLREGGPGGLGFSHPKISDFGLAKHLDGSRRHTSTGVVVGSPSYMAPEQADGPPEGVGPAADVYALGAILYELLTGRPPFTAANPLEILAQVLTAEPVAPTRLQPGTPRDLETVCLRCLAKEPARRYPSARAFADDLRRHLDDRPVLARPAGWAERAVRWARRNRAVAGLTAAVAVLLLGTLAGLGYGLWKVTGLNQDLEAANGREAAERAQAEANAARARDDAALAQAVSGFLQNDLLALASVEGQYERQAADLGKDATVRTLLDRAARQVEGRFRGQPRVEAEVRWTIGVAYRKLGEPALAVPHLERSVALHRQTAGAAAPATVNARNSLGVALRSAGQVAAAVTVLEENQRRARDALPADHPLAMTALVSLAGAYREAGRPVEALPLLEEALRRQQAALGPGHLATLGTLEDLAQAYQRAGCGAEALPMLEKAYRLTRDQAGPDHPLTLAAMTGFGLGLTGSGRAAEAVPLLEEALERGRATLGADHPITCDSLHAVGVAYLGAGRWAEAVARLEEVARLERATLGPDHPDRLAALTNLGQAYRGAGQPAQAVTCLEDAVRLSRAKLGADHPETLLTQSNLGEAYRAARRGPEAVPLLEAALRGLQAQLGPDHPSTQVTRNNLAMAYQDTGRKAAALPLFEETYHRTTAQKGPDHPDTLTARNNLAQAYEAAGRRAEALALLEAALRRRQAALGADHPDTLFSLHHLALAYGKAGRLADGLPLMEAALRGRQSKLGPDHPDTRLSRDNLIGMYGAAGRRADAVPLLEEAVRRDRERLGPDHPDAAANVIRLATFYQASERWADAEPLWTAALPHQRRQWGPASPQLSDALTQLGACRVRCRKWAEAEAPLRECLALCEQHLPAGHGQTAHVRGLLGAALAGQRRFAEAEPLLVAAYDACRALGARPAPPARADVPTALARLVRLYEDWGRPAEAAERRRALIQDGLRRDWAWPILWGWARPW